MSEIIVAYWSGTGNTGAMAEYVAQGIREGGKEAKIVNVENFSADELKDCSVFALGCPSMGVEVLEEGYMEPFMCDVDGFAAGKKIGLFGSYGWGDGEWMRTGKREYRRMAQPLSAVRVSSATRYRMTQQQRIALPLASFLLPHKKGGFP